MVVDTKIKLNELNAFKEFLRKYGFKFLKPKFRGEVLRAVCTRPSSYIVPMSYCAKLMLFKSNERKYYKFNSVDSYGFKKEFWVNWERFKNEFNHTK